MSSPIGPLHRLTLSILKDGAATDGPALVVQWFGFAFGSGVSAAISTANRVLRQLKDAGYVELRKDGWLYITEAGKRAT